MARTRVLFGALAGVLVLTGCTPTQVALTTMAATDNLLVGDKGTFTASLGGWVETRNAAAFALTHNAGMGAAQIDMTDGRFAIDVASHSAAEAKVPVAAGDVLDVSAVTRQVDGTVGPQRLLVEWYTAAGASQVVVPGSEATGILTADTTLAGQVVAPAGAEGMRLVVQFNENALGETYRVLEASVLRVLAPEPTPTTTPPPTTEPTPTPTPTPAPEPAPALAIYGEHVGFGDPTLTTAETRVVTSPADSGPGSLREAVADDTPKHVTFAADMTITLASEIRPGSNTLIDGRGRVVTITGGPTTGGLIIQGVSKVTITDLTLTGFGDLAQTSSNAPEDAIIIEASTDVWLHHLDISRAADKAIAVQAGSVGVTVSCTRIHDQEQTFQIGAQFGGEDVDSVQTVTAHHNYFDGTGYRNPVVSYGQAHVYNNYYRDWASYGARSQRIGQMLFEGNVAFGARDPNITEYTTPGNGCNDAGTRCDDRDGYVKLVGNATLPGSITLRYKENQPAAVFTPPYAYTAEIANQGLADRITAEAGPR